MKTNMALLEKDRAPTIAELKAFFETTISARRYQNTIRQLPPTSRIVCTSKQNSIFFPLGMRR